MKRSIIVALLLCVCAACSKQEMEITISNNSSIDRVDQVIEIAIDNADEYVVYTLEGDAMQCQTTYDGKLLFPATVAAESVERYILRKARRLPLDTVATGKVYPQWFDDFGWENDKIAFRVYSKKLMAQGDKLYGYDIITKRHRMPVLDILYGVNFDPEYKAIHERFQANNNQKAAQNLTTATTYHIDHGLGMDYYTVGPTLGSGTAAIMRDDKIQYPGFYDSCEILDNGGLRLTFRLMYDPVNIDGQMIQEQRTITLDKGTHFNYIEVEYKNLTTPTDIVIGLVMHDMGKVSQRGDNYIAYAEPKHNYGWQTYNAVIYPDQKSSAIQYFEKPIGTAKGHILSKGVYSPEEGLAYYMGAAWNRWGFETPAAWFDYVEAQAQALSEPLTYKIK
ncbi:MAG: DUF4861 family protein [Rikenellaceae bacterium]